MVNCTVFDFMKDTLDYKPFIQLRISSLVNLVATFMYVKVFGLNRFDALTEFRRMFPFHTP